MKHEEVLKHEKPSPNAMPSSQLSLRVQAQQQNTLSRVATKEGGGP
eukprot:CAMPEP_0167792602 /NCGR_PEP_ID=MMETSP0111_2-20121227/12652_1 /TAXON_ID=91324 /ORGANISM="Lotharella globosa, Strain CCCM811" /LENGTH=45 /DNA_ID= /DNA_START= /DNA_END= /DNA_ORIENTATION=